MRGPTRLEWLLHAKAREAINEAVVHAKALCEDLDLVVDCFSTKTGGWVTCGSQSLLASDSEWLNWPM